MFFVFLTRTGTEKETINYILTHRHKNKTCFLRLHGARLVQKGMTMTHTQLKKLLKDHGLTAMDLGRMTGIHYSTIYRYVYGQIKMPEKISNLIELTLASRKE